MICPNCKKEIDSDSRFCRHCGVEFIGEEERFIEITPEENEYIPVAENDTDKKRSKKTILVQLGITLAVLAVFGIIIAAVFGSGNIGTGKETVTDAQGEKIREGRGTTEMSVIDEDGNERTIKTDRSLLTREKILAEYTLVMNQLKTDAPAFSAVRYQNLPTEHQNLGALADFVLPIIERYVTSKSASETVTYNSGNANKLPLPESAYGCLLTDSTKIKNAYCEVLSDVSYKLVITLTDELNPPVLSAGATTSSSHTNSVFDIYDALTEITAISELALNKIDFNYTDCTAVLIYNPDTLQVQSLNMKMNIDITAYTFVKEVTARIVDVTEYTSFTY